MSLKAAQLCAAATLVSAGLSLAALASVALPPPLPDQVGGTVDLRDLPEQPVLVIVAAGGKLRQVQRWEESLRQQMPELLSMRVADIRDKSTPTLEQVASKLAKRAPPDVSIAIDLNNAWATLYELDTAQPCLLLFDEQRQLIAQWRGRARGPLRDEVIARIRAAGPVAQVRSIND